MSLNISHIRLEYVEGGSNKFYRMTVVHNPHCTKSLLIKNWGAIGKEGQYTFSYDGTSVNGFEYDKTIYDKLKKGYSETNRASFDDRTMEDVKTKLKVYGVGEHSAIEGRSLISVLSGISGEDEGFASFHSKAVLNASNVIERAKREKETQMEEALVKRLKNPLYGSW